MKRVKLQPRQHTILLNDEELDIIQAAIMQLVDSESLKSNIELHSMELLHLYTGVDNHREIDITGLEPGVPESLLFCADLAKDFIKLIKS